MKLSGPAVAPLAGGAPTRAVVLLHGYGANGEDVIGLAAYWRDLLPGAVFLAPDALQACGDNPSGYQWFPIDYGRAGYRFDGASAARPVIAEFLRGLWAETGLTPRDTLLGGFSQGAMMALHVGLSLDAPLMGILSFSGALIAPPGLLDGTGPKPPVCLVHGDRDQVVEPARSAEAAETLGKLGFDVSYHVERGAGHTITADGLDYAGTFISRVAG